MRRLFFLATLAVLSMSFVLADDGPSAGSAGLFLPKVARQKLAWLHVGMTRAEVEKNFTMDGGLYFYLIPRYYVSGMAVDAKNIMLELSFQPKEMRDAVYQDEKFRAEWLRARHWDVTGDPQDILRSIGKPYLSPASID